MNNLTVRMAYLLIAVSMQTAVLAQSNAIQLRNGTHSTTLISSPSATSSVIYSLPITDGTNGQVLVTNGSGALSWTNGASTPVFVTADYTVTDDDKLIVLNKSNDIHIALPDPTAAANLFREITFSTLQACGPLSVDNILDKNFTSVVTPIGGGTTFFIFDGLAGVPAGAWVTLVCDGASWVVAAKGITSLDNLSDAKSEGTNFTSSLIIGHQSTGTLSAVDPAVQNTALGISAMQAISTGDDNTSAGYAALVQLTAGSHNTAVGSWSGYEITTGSSNVMIGSQAGHGLETGIGNIAVGAGGIFRNGALQGTDVGNYNIAVGFAAMYAGPSGSMNIGLGYAAGNQLLSGQDNVLIGSQAGFNLTAGSSNVFIGFQAGSDATIDTESNLLMIDNSNTLTPLIYGDFSANTLTFNGATTTTGTSAINGVVSIGGTTTAAGEIRLLEDLDDGSHYTAFKAQAQAANVTYILPAADGTNGQALITDGSGSLSWSAFATSLDGLSDAKSGGAGFTNSLIVGHSTTGTLGTGTGAGGEVDTDNAQFNVGLGYESLEAISSGDGNTGIGYRALKFIETSDNNTAIGNRAMYKATGSENSFVGAWSGGPTVVGNTSSYNSGLGSHVLYSIETGSNNVAVGYNAGGWLTTGSGNILIGYEAGVSLVNESDRLFIDNSGTSYPLIYGDFSSDALTFNGSTTTTGTSAFEDVVSIGGTTTAAGEIRLLEDLDDGSHYTAFKAQAQAANVTYTLPAADGTNGQALITDGSGTLSWKTSAPVASTTNNTIDADVYSAAVINGDPTINGGVNGQSLYLRVNAQTVNVAGFTITFNNFSGGGLTLAKIDGTWYIVGRYDE